MKKILNINERILYIIENQYNNNQKKFAESIGFKAQVVFNIVSGRKSKPSYDVLSAIISTNDNINSEWLLTGNGEIFKDLIIIESTNETNFKELADARLEIIEMKDEKIERLQNENIELKKELQSAHNHKRSDYHI